MSEPSPTSPTPAPVSVFNRIGIAFLVALTYGLSLYLLIWYGGDRSALPFIGGLFLMPMGIASVVTAIADPRGQKRTWLHVRNGWIVITILVLISVVFFREGGICVIMAAPCFLVGSAAGSAITLALLRRFNTTKPASLVITLPLLLLPFEPYLAYSDHQGSVTSIIEINASPSDVWRNTVIIPEISAKELPFSFSHNIVGVPRPEKQILPVRALMLSGNCAGRKACILRKLLPTGRRISIWHGTSVSGLIPFQTVLKPI